jgi:hypothetical protein
MLAAVAALQNSEVSSQLLLCFHELFNAAALPSLTVDSNVPKIDVTSSCGLPLNVPIFAVSFALFE